MPWVCEKCGYLEEVKEWGFKIMQSVYVQCRRCGANYYVPFGDDELIPVVERELDRSLSFKGEG